MDTREKAWPIVLRSHARTREVLAFSHPTAGKQFVKGTIGPEENPHDAAARELREESGIKIEVPLDFLGTIKTRQAGARWHFFRYMSSGLPTAWSHQTEDDFGHRFSFFWHPLRAPLDQGWHPSFHEAFAFFAPLCMPD